LKSKNVGLCNWFLYIATCPEGHSPLLKNTRGSKNKTRQDILFKRILSQNKKNVWEYIMRIIPCWWIETPQAFQLHIYLIFSYYITFYIFTSNIWWHLSSLAAKSIYNFWCRLFSVLGIIIIKNLTMTLHPLFVTRGLFPVTLFVN